MQRVHTPEPLFLGFGRAVREIVQYRELLGQLVRKELKIKYYYAGLTQITDRSLEILGSMESLEQIDLYECMKVTDAGLRFLARLPRLREVHLDSLPGVMLEGTKVFRPGVHVFRGTPPSC